MLTWFITGSVIAGISAALLECFKDENGPQLDSETGRPKASLQSGFLWESMTESDLDALLEEFSHDGDARGVPMINLSV